MLRCILVVLVLCWTACAQAQTKATFFTVVAGQFDKWDADKDGVISKAETDDLVVNPNIKAQSAAALASLHLMQNNKKIEIPPVTRKYLQEAVAVDGKPNQPDFQRRYVNAFNKIQKSERALFASSISLETMHQGRLGDCYLIAPLGALVHRDQSLIRKMFVERTDKGHVVRFADGHTVTVPLLTDTEIALTGTTEGHGLWLAVLEKAVSLVKRQEVSTVKDADSVAGAIGQGGSTMRFIPLFTGHQGKAMIFHQKDSPLKAVEAQVKVKLPEVRELVSKAMSEHRMVCCSTTKETGVPGLSSRHAYAVLGFDAKKDMVYVWNPHGNKFVPKGPAGLVHGYPTTDGKFAMPLAEFVKAFHSVSYEGDAAARYSGGSPKK